MFFACLRPVGARKAFLFGRAPVTVKRMPYRISPKGRHIQSQCPPFLTSQAQYRSLADPVPTPSSTVGTVITVRIPEPVPTPSSTVGTVITFAHPTSRLLAAAGPAFRRRPGVPAPARRSGAGPASYGRPGLVAGTLKTIISTCVDLNWQPHISQMKKALKAGMLRNWFSLSQKYLAGIGMGR